MVKKKDRAKRNFVIAIVYFILCLMTLCVFAVSDSTRALTLNNNGTTDTSDDDYYEISSLADLKTFRSSVESTYGYTNNTIFKLTSDIDLSGEDWTPIGSSTTYGFRGTFDFNGYKITNLSADYMATTSTNVFGLFGYNYGTIVDPYITVADVKFTPASSSITGTATSAFYAGVVAGYNEGIIGNSDGDANIFVEIEDFVVEGSSSEIRVGGVTGIVANGGIVGNSSDGATDIDIQINGNFKAISNTLSAYTVLLGGIVGESVNTNHGYIGNTYAGESGDVNISVTLGQDALMYNESNNNQSSSGSTSTRFNATGGILGATDSNDTTIGVTSSSNSANVNIAFTNNATAEDKGIYTTTATGSSRLTSAGLVGAMSGTIGTYGNGDLSVDIYTGSIQTITNGAVASNRNAGGAIGEATKTGAIYCAGNGDMTLNVLIDTDARIVSFADDLDDDTMVNATTGESNAGGVVGDFSGSGTIGVAGTGEINMTVENKGLIRGYSANGQGSTGGYLGKIGGSTVLGNSGTSSSSDVNITIISTGEIHVYSEGTAVEAAGKQNRAGGIVGWAGTSSSSVTIGVSSATNKANVNVFATIEGIGIWSGSLSAVGSYNSTVAVGGLVGYLQVASDTFGTKGEGHATFIVKAMNGSLSAKTSPSMFVNTIAGGGIFGSENADNVTLIALTDVNESSFNNIYSGSLVATPERYYFNDYDNINVVVDSYVSGDKQINVQLIVEDGYYFKGFSNEQGYISLDEIGIYQSDLGFGTAIDLYGLSSGDSIGFDVVVGEITFEESTTAEFTGNYINIANIQDSTEIAKTTISTYTEGNGLAKDVGNYTLQSTYVLLNGVYVGYAEDISNVRLEITKKDNYIPPDESSIYIDYINNTLIFDEDDLSVRGESGNVVYSGVTKISAGESIKIKYRESVNAIETVYNTIELPASPDAPTSDIKASTITSTSISLSAIAGGEYRIDGGQWQSSTLFTNLEINTTYNFEMRYTASTIAFASEVKEGAISTLDVLTLTFVTNGGDQVEEIQIDYGSEITLPYTVRDNYRFNGWYDNASLSGDAIVSDYIYEDMTYYAGYDSVKYVLSFVTNTDDIIDDMELSAYTSLTELPSVSNGVYELIGWYDNTEFEGDPISTPYTVTANRIFYAKYGYTEISTSTDDIVLNFTGGDEVFVGSELDVEINNLTDDNIIWFDNKATEFKSSHSLIGYYDIILSLDNVIYNFDNSGMTISIKITDTYASYTDYIVLIANEEDDVYSLTSYVEDGYLVFETTQMGAFAIIAKSAETSDSADDAGASASIDVIGIKIVFVALLVGGVAILIAKRKREGDTV